MKLKTILITLTALLTVFLLAGCKSDRAKLRDLEDEFAEYLDETTEATEEETETEAEDLLPEILYVRVPTNMYVAANDIKLSNYVEKGQSLKVLGYDQMDAEGNVRMWKVSDGKNIGYVRDWYVTDDEEKVYDDSFFFELHDQRGDSYGGGDAGELDYFERSKFYDTKTPMPETCRTLYIPGFEVCIAAVDDYLKIAEQSGINAFCINISDNEAISYPSEVMKEVSPSGYAAAMNSLEDYAAVVKKLKDNGYYVIGRITTFHDDYLCKDNPDWSIADQNGDRKVVAGGYWPSAFVREVWEYKIELAQEAVEWFDFDEIQFDYVRFPDGTRKYEDEGSIDFRNSYNESKAQAIQRFLMYATDNLHEMGVAVSADVFGETANDYVAAYGQYWPAISNVVDVISGMPYCDHYASSGDYYPWEHPYETLENYAQKASLRQTECPTPARDRTWIQCYDSIKAPFVIYGPENVGLEIQALMDNGFTGGFLTWNAGGNLEKYYSLIPAFSTEAAADTVEATDTAAE